MNLHHDITPVVSVIMPTWNGERFLRQAIESILNQTFTEFELIVIDDGSTDSTARILADLKDKEARIIVLTNERNLGIASATNKGIAVARGAYIALQDHDDVSLRHRLQTQVDFLESHPDIAVVGSAATLIDNEGTPFAEFPLPCKEINIKWRLLFIGDAFHYTSVMVRRGALMEIGGYGENPEFQFAEAYDPFSRVAMHHRVANLPDSLVLWRRHRDATSIQNAQAQVSSCEAISFRNVCLLVDPQSRSKREERYRSYLGFKAFTSTPAGQFPSLPPEQVLSGLKFFCEVREAFYRSHGFSRLDVTRHRKPLDWLWGKHAVALALRAPWDWWSRVRSVNLGLRCLLQAAWAASIDGVARVGGLSSPEPDLTAPTLKPLEGISEQEAWTKGR